MIANIKLGHPAREAIVLGLCLGLVTIAGSHAQNYSISWHTVDGGGTTSLGGNYSIQGTIGQPDAGVLVGGGFTLEGGFWSGVATPGAPSLRIIWINANALKVSWDQRSDFWGLESCPSLQPPVQWQPIAPPYQTDGQQNWITVIIPSADRFYRLKKGT